MEVRKKSTKSLLALAFPGIPEPAAKVFLT